MSVELESDLNTTTPAATGTNSPPKEKESTFWLNAWRDHMAGVKAFSNCVELADVNGDGDFKLIVADAMRRLKVFSGTSLVTENALMTVPSAVASFYMDYRDEVRRPNIAVASGPYIFIYKNMRPFYKFTFEPIELPTVDVDTWGELQAGTTTAEKAAKKLEEARDHGSSLSTRTIDFLALDNETEREKYVVTHKATKLVQHTVITVMAVLGKDKDEATALGCLIVGTENNMVAILDSSGAVILKKLFLPSTPVFIITAGLYDVEYRIIISCRNGKIYCIKNGVLQGVVIEPEAQPSALARYENLIACSCMNNTLQYYHLKGKKHSTVFLPAAVTNMCSMTNESTRKAQAIAVALANGEVRVYVGKALINKTQVFDTVTAMKYGKYGREDATLVLILKSGSIVLKMLPRTVTLEAEKGKAGGPPPEQDVPLKVPKRTNLYVEQTEREKKFGVDMHRVFQRDLCKLRLTTARAYVKMLTDGQGTMSHSLSSAIRLTAHIQGLGPVFKVKLNIQNTGTRTLSALPVLLTYSMQHYKMPTTQFVIPALVPSLIYTFEVPVECIDEEADESVRQLRVWVCNPGSTVPILTALVKLPVADFLMTQQ